jgi:hypothetical protein
MNRDTIKDYKSDIAATIELHPGLFSVKVKECRGLKGVIVIRDENQIYQGEYEVVILIDNKYPNCFPDLVELSDKIPRIADRHISKEGFACVEIDPKKFLIAQKGILIYDFIKDYCYKYLCGQLYYDKEGKWPGKEWRHQEDGIREFFYELFPSCDDASIARIIEMGATNRLPGRNDDCVCGSLRKLKRCHLDTIVFLKSIPKKYLLSYCGLFYNDK